MTQTATQEPLAIVGIGCRMPGGVTDTESFWNLLVEEKSGIREVPEDRWDIDRYYHPDAAVPKKMITKWGGFVDGVDQFDPQFFGISPREALRMDPQQRWLLECAWEAIEDAGTRPETLRGTNTGCFVGIASNEYGSIQMSGERDIDVHTNSGGTLSIASNRISYLFDLKGPSASVDTACSSALVAVNLACKSIWSGDSAQALAGGVNALLMPDASIGFSKASMLSPSGQCFAFDSRANGYVRGEGAGMLLIKPLAQAQKDGDRVYAVIRASVINQDGNTSSMTVPGEDSQAEMLRMAYKQAGFSPSRVCYMEAHGTGTPVGDPIETRALGKVLCEGRPDGEKCVIGSVKSNIGHLESGSGVAGLIKAAMVLHKSQIPKNLNYENPNPNIPFEDLKLRVPTKLEPLPRQGDLPPITAVNSFGFGGTNAHIVLEEAPAPTHKPAPKTKAERPFILPVSANTEGPLKAYANRYRAFLKDSEASIADICASAATRKSHQEERMVVIGSDRAELRSLLKKTFTESKRPEGCLTGHPTVAHKDIVFVFTGQGAQWWAMGQQLLKREPVFLDTIEKIDAEIRKHADWSLIEEMTRGKQDSNINKTNIAQPAIFALQVALAALWKSWGVTPAKVVGHSVGEVAAAYVAGIYSLEDAVKVIVHRSRLQETTGGTGRMVAVGISPTEAREYIGDHGARVQVAVINSPSMVTIAGDSDALEPIVEKIEADKKFLRWLRIDYAFHTHQMEPIKDALLEALADIQPQNAAVPYYSTVTGDRFHGSELDANYWWRNVREAVLFAPAIDKLARGGAQLFLELGPHPALQSSITDCLSAADKKGTVLGSLKRKSDESTEMLRNLAGLYFEGAEIDWNAVNQSGGDFVRLPSYPWQHESYWLECDKSRRHRLAKIVHPLLGLRTPAPDPTWEFHLEPTYFNYLDDHRFWDSIVFPGAGYGEMGLAIAKNLFPEDNYVVEELVTKKALFVSDKKVPQVRVVFDEKTKNYQVFSTTDDGKQWDLNAEGRLQKLAHEEIVNADLAQLREGLEDHYTHEQYYDEYAAAGYQFGPNFQHLENVWRTMDRALAEIIVPDQIRDTAADYHIHPAVLDATFHAVKGAQKVPADAKPSEHFYLPAAIRRIQLHVDTVPNHLWTHATIIQRTPDSLLSDIEVFDNDGNRVADILGFRVDRVEQKDEATEELENSFYQFSWEPSWLRGSRAEGSANIAATNDITDLVSDAVTEVYQEYDTVTCLKDYAPKADALGCRAVEHAYQDLGWKPQPGDEFTTNELISQLGIVDEHRRLVAAQLRYLALDGVLESLGDKGWKVLSTPEKIDLPAALDALRAEFPQYNADTDLFQLAWLKLGDVLSGELDPLEVLFPGGSSEKLEAFYVKGADFPSNNALIPRAIEKAIAALPERRSLRVLEVGAGTGSLTERVLPVLPADRTEFTFTDNGPAFIAAAKSRFADYKFVDYSTFDIEKPVEDQKVNSNGYDLILATNVVHATSDLKNTLGVLKDTLAPDGMLMFLEVTKARVGLDLVFGLLKGWWQYTDTDLRPESALLNRDQWENLLRDCDFTDVGSFVNTPNPADAAQTIFIARKADTPVCQEDATGDNRNPDTPPQSDGEANTDIPAEPTTIIFGDQTGFSEKLAAQLPGKVLHATTHDDIAEVLTKAENPTQIIHTAALNHPLSETSSAEALANSQAFSTLHLLHLTQALAAADLTPTVTILTRGANSTAADEPVARIASAPIVGFARVARGEHPESVWTLIDLDPAGDENELSDLLAELALIDGETEIAYRNGRRLANRLHQILTKDMPVRTRDAVATDSQYRLQIDTPGILTNLSLNETSRREPGPGEIEISVKAGGINFRDVMKALGMYPGNPIDVRWFGDDFSGTIVRVGEGVHDLKPGDNVAGMAPYCFRAYVTVNRHMVFRKPEHISFVEAATLPTVFLTTHYALNHLAHMRKGERVLIHAGTGGVGMAAIQIAQEAGAEIFSTAGTPEKRWLLKEMGVQHVMDSRSLNFADEVMAITDGEGVDIVLNSLAGDFIPKNFSVLRTFGRFLEIGKIDIYSNSKIGLEPLRNNISFHVIDLAQHLESRPEFVAEMMAEMAAKFEAKTYKPLPHKVFPITEVVEAFRFMAQGKHIGKNVLDFDQPVIDIAPSTEPENFFKSDASYLITGGASGFGFELAVWMAAHGAKNIVLLSRSGPRDEHVKEGIAKLRADGITVTDARGDVTNGKDIRRVINSIDQPLKGIIHGAMVLDDDFLIDLDEERFNKVVHPKMLGAWHLHHATIEAGAELDHFISFSSFSAVIGAVKQANYNAGNFFLDTLAHHRQALGLPALTINWGALTGAGFVERNEKTAAYLEKLGMKAYSMEDTMWVMEQILPKNPTRVAASRVDWTALVKLSPNLQSSKVHAPVALKKEDGEGSGGSVRPSILGAAPEQRIGLMVNFIAEQVAGVFGTEVSKIDRDTPLTNIGLDSLMAIELMNRIESSLGLSIPMGLVLNGPNIKELSEPILEMLEASDDGTTSSAGTVVAVNDGSIRVERSEEELMEFPLSEGQRALWFINQLAPDSSAYNLVFSSKIKPLVDVDVMSKAFGSLFERHPMLDVSFTTNDAGEPVQVVHKGRSIDFREHDATDLSEEELKERVVEHAEKPFNLKTGPVIRLELFKVDDSAHVCALAVHHIVSDAWSIALLMNDLIETYFSMKAGKEPSLEPLDYRYQDFVDWQQRKLASPAAADLAAYWQDNLAGAPAQIDLPTDHPRPAIQSFEGATASFKLDDKLSAQISHLTNEQNVTLYNTLLSAFNLAIHRYCNQDDIVVGCPMAGRNQSEFGKIIGYFTNAVPLRSQIDADTTFIDLLKSTSLATNGALEHQEYPMARIVDDLKLPRDPSRSPLFQVSFAMERVPGIDEQGIALFLIGTGGHQFRVGDITVESIDLSLRQAPFEITLVVEEAGGHIYGAWHYNCDLFDAETIDHLSALFEQVLRQVVTEPSQKIANINLLSKEEEVEILSNWNDTDTNYPKDKPLHQFITEQARKTPQSVAVRCGAMLLTYAELDALSNGLAQQLRDSGVTTDVPVALLVERSTDMVVGALGILKAGGCYIPMDPEYPSGRLQQMLDDAQPHSIVTNKELADTSPDTLKKFLVEDSGSADWAPDAPDGFTTESLAYIIYTSGSTGTPKGVEIPHRAAVNFLTSMRRTPGLTQVDKLLAVTTLSFDISVLEIFLPLMTGAEVVVATRSEARDGRRLAGLIEQKGITVMQATPATWELLLASGWEGKNDLRIFCGGEALPRKLANLLTDSASEVWNLYGPTETTVWSAAEHIVKSDNSPVLVGRPIANTQAYILDHNLHPVPAGFAGDLYLGGDGLARGYHKRPDLTDERFIAIELPDGTSHRVYNTGDLARWTRDGKIECLGRSDFQIKLRGVRIELGDIESQLTGHSAIQNTVVTKRDDLPGGEALVAYLITDREADEGFTNELRAFLKERLPESMVPAFFVKLDEFPLTPNNKTDRLKLPAPTFSGSTGDQIQPQTASEQVLWEIFNENFAPQPVGIRDNFFELGGDSLMAVRILAKVSDAFNRDVPVDAFLRNPTIEQLGRFLHQPAPAKSETSPASSGGNFEGDHLDIEFVEAGQTPDVKVDAIALAYIPDAFLAMTGMDREQIARDIFHHQPRLSQRYETPFGNIGLVVLPHFEIDLYKNTEGLKESTLTALKLGSTLGAKTVSLTGLIPSATNDGLDICRWINGTQDLPIITTGDATRTATVIKSVEGILATAEKKIEEQHVAFVGLGSIGRGTLDLMLEVIGQPKAITLCDFYGKNAQLETLRDQLLLSGYEGEITIAKANGGLPEEVYAASLIIGATSVPGIIDVAKLKPGTLLVDYSFPNAFNPIEAIQRLEKDGDILFTTGGQLTLPEEIKETLYLPDSVQSLIESFDPNHLQSLLGRNPNEITGCVLACLLTGMAEEVKVTLGPVKSEDSLAHYRHLDKLGIQPGALGVDGYFLSSTILDNFREHHPSRVL